MLVNKQGVTDLRQLQLLEEEGLVNAYEALLDEMRTDTPITSELIRYIHRQIFGELYEWAGRWRTVNISKPGITWPPPAYLNENMMGFERGVLAKFPASALGTDQAFCKAVAQIQGEFLVIHPFREGNARTIKLATDLLAAQSERPPLRYDQTDAGRHQYIVAAEQAFKRNVRRTRHLSLGSGALLSTLPLFLGGCGSFVSGIIYPVLNRWTGDVGKSRRLMAYIGFTGATGFLLLSSHLQDATFAMVAMGVASFSNDLVMPGSWAACMDVGGKYAGTLSGAMNMMGNLGGVVSPIVIAYILSNTNNNWSLTFYVSAAVYFAGIFFWWFLDPVTELEA